MHSSHVLAALAACMLCVPLSAASPAHYQAQRATAQLLAIDSTQLLTSQFAGHAGQQVEMEGVVSGIVLGQRSGFLLQDGTRQTLVIFAVKRDPDIAVGQHLRVLATIPDSGTVLEGLAVTVPGKHYGRRLHAAPLPSAVSDTQCPLTLSLADLTGGSGPAGNAISPLNYAAANADEISIPSVPDYTSAPIDPALRMKVLCYAAKIRQLNHCVSADDAHQIAYGVLVKSPRYGVDPRLVFALLVQESRFNPRAVSCAGAQGLGQLMPKTARRLGVRDAFDIYDNLDGSIRYLKQQLVYFNGNYRYALAAYNAGPKAVIRYNGIPPYAETVNYVRVISSHYKALTQQHSL